MQIEQQVGKLRRRKHRALDAPQGSDEVRANIRIEPHETARDSEAGVQVSARPAAGEEDGRGHARGFVAAAPMTRSFALPMFTRMPVMNIVRTMFERP